MGEEQYRIENLLLDSPPVDAARSVLGRQQRP